MKKYIIIIWFFLNLKEDKCFVQDNKRYKYYKNIKSSFD